MYAAVLISMAAFAAVLVELIAGSYGFWIPAAAWIVFYASVTYGWQSGVMLALIQGAAIDAVFGRDRLLSSLVLLAVVAIARVWIHRADGKTLWMRALPGMLIGLVCVMPQAAIYAFRLGSNPDLILSSTLSCFFSIALSTLALPLATVMLDSAAILLGLPLFAKARERLIHHR